MNLHNNFREDIEYLLGLLKDNKSFSFSKFADGEYKVLRNIKITNCDGWTFNPDIHHREHQMLVNSFKYQHDNYIVGISCPCCQPLEHVQWMRDNVGSKNVTWANIFVNSNYKFFTENFFPIFDKWKGTVILIGNIKGFDNYLPFRVDRYIPIDLDSWKEPEISVILKHMKYIASINRGKLFLFSAGFIGNILAHQLHTVNPYNTYIDIGSTVNPYITGNNRGYLRGKNNKTCIW